MCETLAEADGTREFGTYSTVGLFSVLDVLAGRPMAEILAELPLSQGVKAALLNREGPLGATLQAVLDYEAELRTPRDQSDPRSSQIARVYLDAVSWTDTLFAELADR
jgi:EAL and modified HD-GYP domain-containing signal transduction protein